MITIYIMFTILILISLVFNIWTTNNLNSDLLSDDMVVVYVILFAFIFEKIVRRYCKTKLLLKNFIIPHGAKKTEYELLMYKELKCSGSDIDFFASTSFMIENSSHLTNDSKYAYGYIQNAKLEKVKGYFVGKVENGICQIYFDNRERIKFTDIVQILEENNAR